jgi:hypothetical protein
MLVSKQNQALPMARARIKKSLNSKPAMAKVPMKILETHWSILIA